MSIRAVFFRMMMRAQNINPIAHPGMKDKMKQMSAKYSHTKPKKGYTLIITVIFALRFAICQMDQRLYCLTTALCLNISIRLNSMKRQICGMS